MKLSKTADEDKPLVSIITVCLNGEDTIEQTIQSVINQTYTNIEYIIIDGVSTDGTLEIIDRYKNKISQLISEKDKGIYDAMNKGLKLATGDIIGILNSDDWYERDTVENIVNTLLEDRFAQVIYGNTNIYNRDNFMITKYPAPIERLRTGMPIPHPPVFISGEVYKKYGFETKYGRHGDRELLLKLYSQNYRFAYINKTIVNYRMPGYDKLGFPLRRAIHNMMISFRYMNNLIDIPGILLAFLKDLVMGLKGVRFIVVFIIKWRRGRSRSHQPL